MSLPPAAHPATPHPAPAGERRRGLASRVAPSASQRSAQRASAAVRALPSGTTVLCFSHLRWNFVYQRPQHLMAYLARGNAVVYVEEPVHAEGAPHLEVREAAANITVLVPHLPAAECAPGHVHGEARQRRLLASFLAQRGIERPVCWYYTPMSVALGEELDPALVVYDCMDELSAFANAPPQLLVRERQLMAEADVVFTGGHSLFEAKCDAHPHVHPFPSSVDVPHFAAARHASIDPPDMAGIAGPRIGFYGVIDERLDVALLTEIARLRPQWQFVLIGPVVKIDPTTLPQAANLHFLGSKHYDELPQYLGRWDVAMMPFALNESTRYISPTKTPEYLAGGCPVVSTPITDVVRSYGGSGVVHIAADAASFVAAIDAALVQRRTDPDGLASCAAALLRSLSWERTGNEMAALMVERLQARRSSSSLAATQRLRVPMTGAAHHAVGLGLGAAALSAVAAAGG